MLPVLGERPARVDQYAFEVKWDGVRAMVAVERGKVRVVSRSGRDMSATYPELAGLAGQLQHDAVLLDGELVAFDADGQPSFAVHQRRMHVRQPSPSLVTSVPVMFCVFDLVWSDGASLVDVAWRERRARLEDLALSGPSWRTPAVSIGDPLPIEEIVDNTGLEGFVAKRVDSRYRPGLRSPAWIKVKRVHRQEFVVGGWTAGEGRRSGSIGSLLVGGHVNGRLHYAGRVGSGLDAASTAAVAGRLQPRSDSPFDGPVPGPAAWAEPLLVVEVRYGEWTPDGLMRHPVFLGIRTDKEASEVLLER